MHLNVFLMQFIFVIFVAFINAFFFVAVVVVLFFDFHTVVTWFSRDTGRLWYNFQQKYLLNMSIEYYFMQSYLIFYRMFLQGWTCSIMLCSLTCYAINQTLMFFFVLITCNNNNNNNIINVELIFYAVHNVWLIGYISFFFSLFPKPILLSPLWVLPMINVMCKGYWFCKYKKF